MYKAFKIDGYGDDGGIIMFHFKQYAIILLSLIVCVGVAYESYNTNKDRVYTATTLAVFNPKDSYNLERQTKSQQKVKALQEYAYSSNQMNYLYKRIQNVSNITDNYDSLKSSYGVTSSGSNMFLVWSNDVNKSAAIRKSRVGYLGIKEHLDSDRQYSVRVIRKPQITESFITYNGHRLRNYIFSGAVVGLLIGVLFVIILDGDKG